MAEENSIQKEQSQRDPKKDDAKDSNFRRRRFCCLGLIIFFLVLATAVSIRTYFKVSADKNGLKPSPTVTNYPPKSTSTPDDLPTKESVTAEPTGEPAPEPTSVEAGPTKEQMINFFVELTLRDDTGQHSWPLHKWAKTTIKIGFVEGAPSQGMVEGLDSLISDYNSVSNTKLQRNDSSPDIKIYVLTPAEINVRTNGLRSDSNGYYYSEHYVIYAGEVYMAQKPTDTHDYDWIIIRHEITHALGFLGHSDLFRESVMAVAHMPYNFPECDRKLLKMLFNTSVPKGSDEAAVRNYFNTNYP